MNNKILKSIASRYKNLDKGLREGNLNLPWVADQYSWVRKDGKLSMSHLASARPEEGDEKLGYIPFIVTVYEEDRDGDIVVPRGRYGENYKHNPTWFFGHQSHPIPIGTSRVPGTLDQINIDIHDTYIKQGCYFDLADPDAHFLYGKVKRGMLNSTSIAFVPIKAYRRDRREKAQTHGGQSVLPPGWFFEMWDHTETSVVGVGANPGAIRDWMDTDKSYISPNLYKGLGFYAVVEKGMWNGWAPPCPPGFCEKDGTCVPIGIDSTSKSSSPNGDLSINPLSNRSSILSNSSLPSQVTKDTTVSRHNLASSIITKCSKGDKPCKDCSEGKACSCDKSTSPIVKIGPDQSIDSGSLSGSGKGKPETYGKDRLMTNTSNKSEVSKGGYEDWERGFADGKREAESKKRQGQSLSPIQAASTNTDYDKGYRDGYNSVLGIKKGYFGEESDPLRPEWWAVERNGKWYIRNDKGQEKGPYSDSEEAETIAESLSKSVKRITTKFYIGERVTPSREIRTNSGEVFADNHSVLRVISTQGSSIEVQRPKDSLTIIRPASEFGPAKSLTESSSRLKVKQVIKYISHEGSKWVVHAESGKVLGTHTTKEDAERQLRAVEANKYKDFSGYTQADLETPTMNQEPTQKCPCGGVFKESMNEFGTKTLKCSKCNKSKVVVKGIVSGSDLLNAYERVALHHESFSRVLDQLSNKYGMNNRQAITQEMQRAGIPLRGTGGLESGFAAEEDNSIIKANLSRDPIISDLLRGDTVYARSQLIDRDGNTFCRAGDKLTVTSITDPFPLVRVRNSSGKEMDVGKIKIRKSLSNQISKVQGFKVDTQGNIAFVRRISDGEIICDGKIGADGRLHDIRFSHPDYQRNNKTRQAAMRAFQDAGYKSLAMNISKSNKLAVMVQNPELHKVDEIQEFPATNEGHRQAVELVNRINSEGNKNRRAYWIHKSLSSGSGTSGGYLIPPGDMDVDSKGVEVCPLCNGKGNCGLCGGEGVVTERDTHSGTDKTSTCKECKGSGNCPECDGAGFIEKTYSMRDRNYSEKSMKKYVVKTKYGWVTRQANVYSDLDEAQEFDKYELAMKVAKQEAGIVQEITYEGNNVEEDPGSAPYNESKDGMGADDSIFDKNPPTAPYNKSNRNKSSMKTIHYFLVKTARGYVTREKQTYSDNYTEGKKYKELEDAQGRARIEGGEVEEKEEAYPQPSQDTGSQGGSVSWAGNDMLNPDDTELTDIGLPRSEGEGGGGKGTTVTTTTVTTKNGRKVVMRSLSSSGADIAGTNMLKPDDDELTDLEHPRTEGKQSNSTRVISKGDEGPEDAKDKLKREYKERKEKLKNEEKSLKALESQMKKDGLDLVDWAREEESEPEHQKGNRTQTTKSSSSSVTHKRRIFIKAYRVKTSFGYIKKDGSSSENPDEAELLPTEEEATTKANDMGGEVEETAIEPKHGAQVLAALHQHYKAADDYLNGEMQKAEPEVSDLLEEHKGKIGPLLEHTKNDFESRYPDHNLEETMKGLEQDANEPGGHEEAPGELGTVELGDIPEEEGVSPEQEAEVGKRLRWAMRKRWTRRKEMEDMGMPPEDVTMALDEEMPPEEIVHRLDEMAPETMDQEVEMSQHPDMMGNNGFLSNDIDPNQLGAIERAEGNGLSPNGGTSLDGASATQLAGPSDPDTEEILERYQGSNGKWYTRVKGIGRRSKSGKLYLIKSNFNSPISKEEGTMDEDEMEVDKSPVDKNWYVYPKGQSKAVDGPYKNPVNAGQALKMIAKGQRKPRWFSKSLVKKDDTGEAEFKVPIDDAASFLEGVGEGKSINKSLALFHAKSLRKVAKGMTDMGKFPANGGKGSPLTNQGKVEANGAGGSELKNDMDVLHNSGSGYNPESAPNNTNPGYNGGHEARPYNGAFDGGVGTKPESAVPGTSAKRLQNLVEALNNSNEDLLRTRRQLMGR